MTLVISLTRRLVLQGQARRLATAALSLFGARAISMLVSFASVPIALNYLGPDRYGLWMAATSLVFILTSFADGGIANGLITSTAKNYKRGGDADVRMNIASAAAILVPVSIGLILLAAIFVPQVSWEWAFNLADSEMQAEAGSVVFLVLASAAAGFAVSIIIKVRIGLQQMLAVSVWEGGAALAALAALLLAVRLNLSLVYLVAAVVGAPLLVKFVGVIPFLYQRPTLRPRLSDIHLARAYDLLGSGSVFFFIALTQAIAIQSDQVLIAKLVDVSEVASYSVVQRLFTIPYILANFVFAVQWPAFSAAASKGDYMWVKRVFRRTLFASAALAALFSIGLVLLHKPILSFWVGDSIQPTGLLVLGMAAYAVLLVLVGACSTLLISLDIRREQIWLNVSMMLVNLPLSIYLIPKVGSAGAIIGTAVSYLFCMVIPYAFIIPRILRERAAGEIESAA